MLGNNAAIAGTFPKVDGFAATTANIHNDLFKTTGGMNMNELSATMEVAKEHAERINKIIPRSVVFLPYHLVTNGFVLRKFGESL